MTITTYEGASIELGTVNHMEIAMKLAISKSDALMASELKLDSVRFCVTVAFLNTFDGQALGEMTKSIYLPGVRNTTKYNIK